MHGKACDDHGTQKSLLQSFWRLSFKVVILIVYSKGGRTQRFQSADSGLDGCFQQKQSVIGSVGSSTSPDLAKPYIGRLKSQCVRLA
jgi:hypothetical protein